MSKILLLGAPGNISESTIELLAEQKHELFAITNFEGDLSYYDGKVTFFRGNRDLKVDLEHAKNVSQAEIVIDYSCFTAEQAQLAVEIFQDEVKQYVFLSTVDVYGYPLSQLPMPESGKWNAPNCDYAANKAICEEIFKNPGIAHLPLTIVRPAYSMGKGFLLTALSRSGGYSLIPRLLAGKPIFSPGDGTALIHAGSAYHTGRMIACIAGDERCIGEDFTLAHDFVLTYDNYISMVAELLNATPNFVHIPSDFVYESGLPGIEDVLLNDLTRHNVFFDNSKFRKFFPDFKWDKPLQETMKEFITANQGKFEDLSTPSFEDKLISAYQNKR